MTNYLPTLLELVGVSLIIGAAALFDYRLGMAVAGCLALAAAYVLWSVPNDDSV